MRNVYFTPGPSALYFTVEHHLKQALKQGIASVSHRSDTFKAFFAEAESNLRTLVQLPEDYQLVFTNSASEIWEKMTDAFVAGKSLHLVNGAFAGKFYKVVKDLGKQADSVEAPWGELPGYAALPDAEYDLIGLVHNETSTGVKTPLAEISRLRQQYPEALIALDAVSSLPVVDLNYADTDMVYASVQKAFGLPAGLGVWLLNDRARQRALAMQQKGLLRQTIHNATSLINQAKNYQTPSTPNILGIYLFAKVTGDMIDRGIQQIRNDGIYKAAIMYNMLDQHAVLRPFVKDKALRSDTIIVIDAGPRTHDLLDYLARYKMIAGNGYGKMKGKQVRIANFPTHSKEQFEMLTDLIEKFK